MRKLLALLVLVALCVPLTGCSGGACGAASEPYMKVKSPVWFGSDPVIQPSGYSMPAPAAPRMQYAVPYTASPCAPQFVAPAASPCAPQLQYAPQVPYSTPYNWAPAPMAAPAAGCSR